MGCNCDNREPREWKGSGIKYAVHIGCEGFDMDEDEWRITIKRGARSIVFTRENAIHGDDGQWYICIDTSEMTSGDIYIIYEALVPDEDFVDGFRREIKKLKLTNLEDL